MISLIWLFMYENSEMNKKWGRFLIFRFWFGFYNFFGGNYDFFFFISKIIVFWFQFREAGGGFWV